MGDPANAVSEGAITITENAAKRLAALLAAEASEGLMFRVAVTGGGCSGFQYNFSFDDTRQPDDLAFDRDGVTVLVDPVSIDLLKGAELDFVEDLVGASFQMRNPNATASCGCGNSFAA